MGKIIKIEICLILVFLFIGTLLWAEWNLPPETIIQSPEVRWEQYRSEIMQVQEEFNSAKIELWEIPLNGELNGHNEREIYMKYMPIYDQLLAIKNSKQLRIRQKYGY